MKPSVASLYQAVELEQDIRPLLIGERCNANGSRKFRDLLLAEDDSGCLKIAVEQEGAGAHVLDLCTAYAGRDEKADLVRLTTLFARSVKLPLMIDSTTPDCIETCLRLYPGRAIVNSINLEDGGRNLDRICRVVKKFGAAVVALTIHEKGMAMTADEKVATARRIRDLAVDQYGLRPSDLMFDALTFTVGSGDETLRDAAIQTLEAIRRIKAELPGVLTVLGLSNISFGLPPYARRVLNSVFLHEAVEAGLDAAIIDAAKILPLASIVEEDRRFALDLLFDRTVSGEPKPLMRFIEHFADKTPATGAAAEKDGDDQGPAEQGLHKLVLRGDREGLEDLLSILMRRYPPVAIINNILVPAMREVGELFGRGEILLPFVLQSAEVMKRAVTHLEPFMDKAAEGHGVRILLATVQGDVHDIGKNLVDIILSNNGYKVFNLGIKVPAETIIAKAREYQVDLVGLSGLLVKSAIVMKECMPQYKEAGLGVPILLGGAALTRKYVATECAAAYDRPVVYCADAFAGLKAVRDFEAGRLQSTSWDPDAERQAAKPAYEVTELDRTVAVPKPPFLGPRHIETIDPAALYPLVNEVALFRGRWGYRRAKMSAAEYEDLMQSRVRPLYEELKTRAAAEGWLQPRVAYGYFPCASEGDVLNVEWADRTYAFPFPRRQSPPHLCIADYFKTREEGGDVVGFFVASIGERIGEEIHKLFTGDNYHDYLMLHGFSVELTDALAEYWHEVMRTELGIGGGERLSLQGYVTQEYRGSRYGFGYPACPDLGAHRPLFELLDPAQIGVTLTDSMEMVPEQTTSAIIVHHPQAKYFAV